MSRVATPNVSISIPQGWFGTSTITESGMPVLHAANFPLPGNDDTPADAAQTIMADGDILITVWEYARSQGQPVDAFTPMSVPPQISPSSFARYEGVAAPAYALECFELNSQLLQVGVAFGSSSPRAKAIASANAVVASLSA